MHFIILVESVIDCYYPAFVFSPIGVDVEKKVFLGPPIRPKDGRVINYSFKIPLILEMLYTKKVTIDLVVFKKTQNVKLLTNVARRERKTDCNSYM